MRVPVRRLPQTHVSEQQQGYARAAPGLDVTPITDAIDGYRNQLREEQRDRQKFDINKRLMQEINELQSDFEQRQRNPEISPIDFADSINTTYQERHRALLDGLHNEGFDRDLIDEMDLKLGTVRQGFFEKGLAHQIDALAGRAVTEIDDLVTHSSQYIAANPTSEAYASTRDMLEQSISSMPDLLETQRTAKVKESLGVLRDAGGKALAIHDPQYVVDTLDPQGLTAPHRAPSAASPTTGGTITAPANSWQGVATSVASELGLDPIDVAAVFSYETAGTFSPTIKGGNNSNYMGLIQFGQEERRKYGITEHSTPEQWSAAILGFMHDRGFRKGMSLLDFYSTINAGSPGHPNASDGPGNTVTTHVNRLLSEHKEKAAQWLGVGTSNDPVSRVDIPASSSPQSNLLGDNIPQPVIAGNLPLDIQQIVHNEDGTVSTVRTISIGTDKGEVLIPTVVNGKVVSDEEATRHYQETGENFGTFNSVADADAFAQALHEKHERELPPQTIADARTGNALLDDMNGPERLQALGWAREQLNRVNALRKAEMDVTIGNITTEALNNGGEIATPLPTQEDVLSVYGPVEGPQRWAQIQQSKDTGKAIQTFRTQSAETIQHGLDALKPQPGSPTYETEMQIYQSAERAAQQLLTERQSDPAAYAMKYFPSVGAAAKQGTAQYYAALDRVYETLGIDTVHAPVMSAEATRNLIDDYKVMNPSQKLNFMKENFAGMGEDRFRRFVSQMEGTTAQEDALIYALLRTYPRPNGEWAVMYQQVLEGREIIARDPARKPSSEKLNQQFQASGLAAVNNLNADASRAIQESAAALYVLRGGDPKTINTQLYRESLAAALGGNLPVNMRKGHVTDYTILPPRVSQTTFQNWTERQTFESLTHMSVEKRPPRYGDLKTLAQTQDIIDDGVYVMVSPGRYMIKMKSDGRPLMTSTGRPFLVNINPQDVNGR